MSKAKFGKRSSPKYFKELPKHCSTEVINEVASALRLGSEIDGNEHFDWLFNSYTKPLLRQSESKDSKHIFTLAVTAAFAAL
jgi:hypothetical protein